MSTRTAKNARREPAQARARETVEAIVEAAAQVFERHGYGAGTTNRIAERAGVSIGSLYEYFPNKDALLVELSKRHLREGRAVLAPVIRRINEDPPPLDQGLLLLMDAMVQSHRDRPRLQRVMYAEAPPPPELQDRYARAVDGLSEVIERYLTARHEVTVHDRRAAARLVAEVMWHITHGPIIDGDPARRREFYATETVTLLTRYLTA